MRRLRYAVRRQFSYVLVPHYSNFSHTISIETGLKSKLAFRDDGHLQLTQPPLQLIRGDHETFNGLIFDESIHNLRDVRSRNAPVKIVIGFD